MNTTALDEARAMSHDELYFTLVAMRRYGGSFAKALAEAWENADAENADTLARAFPDLLLRYGPGSAFFKHVSEAA